MMLRWIVSALFVFQIYVMMVVIGLLWAPWAYFSRDGAYHCCKSYSRWVFWTARWMVGIETEVRGRPPEGEVIVAAKHQSFLDVMMIFTALPRARFVMKQAILYTPVIGLYGKRLGCVPVVRGKGGSLAKMVQDVAAFNRVPRVFEGGVEIIKRDRFRRRGGSIDWQGHNAKTVF